MSILEKIDGIITASHCDMIAPLLEKEVRVLLGTFGPLLWWWYFASGRHHDVVQDGAPK